jgi:hypothetical protein
MLLGAGLALATVAALWPQPTYASCSLTDVGCFIDEGLVSMLRFLAQIGWFFNGSLLLLSRWIEEQRAWLITDVMAALFTGLLRGSMVAWAQAVVIAVVLFVIGFSLRAIVELNWVDVRRAIRNGLIALIVFTYGAQLMAASETARVDLSMAAAQVAVDSLSTAGAVRMLSGGSSRPGDLMSPMATIYPGAACGGIVPPRATTTMFINDVAANYLFATAEDIHCPSAAGASQNTPALPAVFWAGGTYPTASMGTPERDAPVTFEGYYRVQPGAAANPADRQRIVALAMDGVIRQLFGLFLTIPAVIEQVIQLVFALGLATLWLSLTIGLVFALFVPTEGMLSSIGRSAVELVKSSILTTIGVTLVSFVVRVVAGSSGVNAGLVALIGLLCLVVLVVILVTSVRTVFTAAASMAGITLGAAPAALLGTLGGVGMVAAMAMKAAPEAVAAGREAGAAAEERARTAGASDAEAKAAGHRAAIAARQAAFRSSAMRTMTDIGRAATDAAGFFDDPLRQSMRWMDRADAIQRQQDLLAAMERRDDRPEIAPPVSQTGIAARLRSLPPASPDHPYTTQTMALNGQPVTDPDAATPTARANLERAQRDLEQVQRRLAAAQGRAAVQKPSPRTMREVQRLEQAADRMALEVARLRRQLEEAELVQRQVSGDAESRRAWDTVQTPEGQRNAATGTPPQIAIPTAIAMAQQQLDREQQQLDRRPPGDPTVADDRAWLQQPQAAVASLRLRHETLSRPDITPDERAAAEAAIRQIRDAAEREQDAARQSGAIRRAQIAGTVAALAQAMLPAETTEPRAVGVPTPPPSTDGRALQAGAVGVPTPPPPADGRAPQAGAVGVPTPPPPADGRAPQAGAVGVPTPPPPADGRAPQAGAVGVPTPPPPADGRAPQAGAVGVPTPPPPADGRAPQAGAVGVPTPPPPADGRAPQRGSSGAAPQAAFPMPLGTAPTAPSSTPAPSAPAAPGMASGAPAQPNLAQRLREPQGDGGAPPAPIAPETVPAAPLPTPTAPESAATGAAAPAPIPDPAPARGGGAVGVPPVGVPPVVTAPGLSATPPQRQAQPGGVHVPPPVPGPDPAGRPAPGGPSPAAAEGVLRPTQVAPGAVPSSPSGVAPAPEREQAPAGTRIDSGADTPAPRRRLRVGGVARRER